MDRKLSLFATAVIGLLAAVLLIASPGGVSTGKPQLDLPLTDFPEYARQENWRGGSHGYGSCAYAALDALLILNGCEWQAEHVRANYGGGAGLYELQAVLSELALAYQDTDRRDLGFIDRATADGRCCVVGLFTGGDCVPYCVRWARTSRGHWFRPGHALVVFYSDADHVGLYDNNHMNGPIRWVSRNAFLADWQGWAITPYVE